MNKAKKVFNIDDSQLVNAMEWFNSLPDNQQQAIIAWTGNNSGEGYLLAIYDVFGYEGMARFHTCDLCQVETIITAAELPESFPYNWDNLTDQVLTPRVLTECPCCGEPV